MEAETGTKISIRGKGSVKEGKNNNQEGADDDLHAVITGDSEDRVQACITMINKIVETV
jgi:splicing factor 1